MCMTKIGMYWQVLVKLPSIKFYDNALSSFLLLHVDRHGKASGQIRSQAHTHTRCTHQMYTILL
jgi:hypothetical protein